MKKYWITALLFATASAWARPPDAPTLAEVAMCAAKGMPAVEGRWQGHYCEGLRFLDRAYAAVGNKHDMEHYLTVAIDEFNYMINHPKEGDFRRGEYHVGKARALKLMGRKAEAAAEFQKTLNYNINSPDVYQAVSDHFHEIGTRQKALEMATEGLRRYPNSKGLKRRYVEFGGSLPYPEAVAESISIETVEQRSSTDAGRQSADLNESGPTIGPMPEAERGKVGSPSNPFCRFCPD